MARRAQCGRYALCAFLGGALCLGLLDLPAFAQSPQMGVSNAKGAGIPFQEKTLRALVRHHGDYLDEKHMFLVEEEDGIVTFKLRKNERAPGGPQLYISPETGEDESVIRFKAEEMLARVRSEVLLTAAPNYVKNPGQRYRITVEGIGLSPEYGRVFEVDAYDAIDAVYAEIAKVLSDTHGIQREALYYGLQVGLQWLNEDQRFPSSLPLTVMRGRAGQRYIRGQYLSRGDAYRLQRFESEQGEQRFIRVQRPVTPSSRTVTPASQAPSYRRGRPTTVERGQAPKPTPYRGREDLVPVDPREQRMRGLRDPQPRREKPGMPGKPLTVPEQPYAAVDAASMENLEIIMGEQASPLTLRSMTGP
ncbi:MAG TPA: hypothetical protein PKI11_10230 [Candidatus Hydrogenedentes bacterium]|nr:hypothetical protein [Candidatus Hydrogenedentota bacterium]